MHGGGGGGFGGWGGDGLNPKSPFPPGFAPDGPLRGRWFGEQGPLRGRRGTMMLLVVLALVGLLLGLSFAL